MTFWSEWLSATNAVNQAVEEGLTPPLSDAHDVLNLVASVNVLPDNGALSLLNAIHAVATQESLQTLVTEGMNLPGMTDASGLSYALMMEEQSQILPHAALELAHQTIFPIPNGYGGHIRRFIIDKVSGNVRDH
jgi:hypothetical protein